MRIQKRKNPIDTKKELYIELKETLDTIADGIDEFNHSIPFNKIKSIINKLSKSDLYNILLKTKEKSPKDCAFIISRILSISDDEIRFRRRIKETVKQGFFHSLSSKDISILYKEIFQNDPNLIKDLNKVELAVNLLTLRFRLQEEILNFYSKKYQLEISDIDTLSLPKPILKVKKEIKDSYSTISLYDDYLADYKMALIKDYEPEETIFLARKVFFYAKKENRKLSDSFIISYKKYLKKNLHYLKYLKISDMKKSPLPFSFHQKEILGSIYNFAYFSQNAFNNEFRSFPKVSRKRKIILFLHGVNNNWANWRPMIRILSKKYDLLIPDMNGFGDSEELIKIHNFNNYAEYVEYFLSEMQIRKFSIIGHSAGAFTIQELIFRNKCIPSKAIFISSAPYLSLNRFFYWTAKFLNKLPEKIIKDIFFDSKKILWKFGKGTKEYNLEYKYRTLTKSSPRTMIEIVRSLLFDYNIRKKRSLFLGLIVAGNLDRRINSDLTNELRKVFPKSKILKVPEADHVSIIRLLATKYKNELFTYLDKNDRYL